VEQEPMLEVRIICPDHLKEIITAELGQLPYEGFWDSDDAIIAYIRPALFVAKDLSSILRQYELENNFSLSEVQAKNWNEEWESQFKPFELGKQIRIRAEFHAPAEGFTYQITIRPKMSFGTGHHETTRLMMEMMLSMPLKNASVLDMGSGTGILAILAEKMGAQSVMAIDNDVNACENMPENFEINQTEKINFKCGGKETLSTFKDSFFRFGIEQHYKKHEFGAFT
jgi:ribosomal protein L11 methyltransferase